MSEFGAEWKHSSTKLHAMCWLLAVYACKLHTIVCLPSRNPVQLEQIQYEFTDAHRSNFKDIEGLVQKFKSDPERISLLNGKNERIYGGEKAKPGQYAYTARIMFGSDLELECGGAILTNRFILTAAHCFINYLTQREWLPENATIFVGDYDRADISNGEQILEVKRLILHPDWNQSDFSNDIGLVETKESMTIMTTPSGFGDVAKICDVVSKPMEKMIGVVGWGVDLISDRFIDVMIKITVPLIEYRDCYDIFMRFDYSLPPGVFCAGFSDNTMTGVCKGCGSPAVSIPIDQDCAYLVGILSSGDICKRKLPGIYTNVSYHWDWVLSVISF